MLSTRLQMRCLLGKVTRQLLMCSRRRRCATPWCTAHMHDWQMASICLQVLGVTMDGVAELRSTITCMLHQPSHGPEDPGHCCQEATLMKKLWYTTYT